VIDVFFRIRQTSKSKTSTFSKNTTSAHRRHNIDSLRIIVLRDLNFTDFFQFLFVTIVILNN